MRPSRRLIRKHFLLSALATLAVLGVVGYLAFSGRLNSPEHFFYDLHFHWRGPVSTSGHIVLVMMDEPSADALQKGRNRWSRHHLSEALAQLCRAGASVVGIDLVLAFPDSDPSADRRLAAAVSDCGNVVLARVSASPSGEIVPLAEFSDEMIGDGFIDLPLDRDDVLRRIRFLTAKPIGGQGLALIPSFSLELARVWKNLDFSFDFSDPSHLLIGEVGEDRLALPYPELLIDFSGDYSAFPQISFSDAVAGRFDDKTVAGRIVLIGSVRAMEKDFFTTPYTRFRNVLNGYDTRFGALVEDFAAQKEPGVACHAHAVETLLRESWIRKVSSHWTTGLFFLAGLAGLLFFVPGVSLRWAGLGFIGVELSLLGTAHFMFQSAGLWLPIVPAALVFMGQFVAGAALQKVYEQRKNALVTSLFGKYVSPAVAADILAQDLEDALAGQRREVSILFSDLRGFTSLSERLGAHRTGRLLNIYFDAMLPLVFAHEGTLDKLMGDAVMAFFGAPAEVAEHPVRAAETALSMLAALDALKKGGEPDTEALEIGIGINTGEVTVGNLGSAAFMDYTIIGDAVNLASRLEGLNKIYKTQAIASQDTVRRLGQRFVVRELDRVQVKGKTGAVTIYELIGYRQRVSEARISALNTFEAGLAAFRQRQWDRAESLFSGVLDRIVDDGPSLCYLDRIEALRKHPPAKDWDGVAVFIEK